MTLVAFPIADAEERVNAPGAKLRKDRLEHESELELLNFERPHGEHVIADPDRQHDIAPVRNPDVQSSSDNALIDPIEFEAATTGRWGVGELAEKHTDDGRPEEAELTSGDDDVADVAKTKRVDGILGHAVSSDQREDNVGSMPGGFALFDDGVYMIPDNDTAEPVYVCSPIRVDAFYADRNGRGWGKLIAVKDPDGRWHELSVASSDLSRRPADVIGQLIDHGLDLARNKGSKDWLVDLLKVWKPGERLLAVSRGGWVDETHSSFVLGDQAIGEAKVLSRLPASGVVSGLVQSGELAAWRENVGIKCCDNPLMIAAVSLAFSGPLLAPLGFDGGGLHFRGASSSGKTTLLRLAASVWGGQRLVTQWRATSNGLEAIASTLNDLLLPLDELAEISARELDEAIYMLANGTGKARMTKDATQAPQDRWRLAMISSGEISVEAKLREARRDAKAGHEVRLVDIEADSRAHGVFDCLHGASSASSFAESVNASVRSYHGSAGRAFVQRLANGKSLPDSTQLNDAMNKCAREWLSKLPGSADGQTSRVAKRFALIGSAGHLATGFGITGWSPRAAIECAESLFLDWYDRRYGERHEAADDHVKVLQRFLETNENNLRPVGDPGDRDPVGWSDPTRVYLPAVTWSQIFPGVSGTAAAKALIDLQILVPGDGRPMRRVPRTIPGRPRLYTVNTGRLASFKVS